ncbi:MAG TPA: MlaD family protein [Thermoleophilaceae bacterium]|nr:MlaD family protein [Thermoleophilaceae bacterium]
MRRGLPFAALLAALIVLVVVLTTSGGGTTYKLDFQNAGQLVTGDQVQIGGVPAGSVKDIELTPSNRAQITISVDKPYAPLHEGTTAVIRSPSLSGVASRYISLTPGPNFKPKLRSGATLTGDSTTSIVDLDQLFNTLDPSTRRALRQVIQGSATQYQGKERLANLTAHYFSPALATTTQVEDEIASDNKAFTDFLVNTSNLVTALSERRSQLTDLVTNAGQTANAVAAQSQSLSQGLGALPDTLRQGNSTFVDLRSALGDLDKLVAASKIGTKGLAPFLKQLRPVVTEAVPTVRQLRQIIYRPGASNDLTDQLRQLPHLAKLTDVDFPRAVETLRQSEPIIEFIRPYAPDLVGFLRDFGQGASPYDANGHYVRVTPIFDAFNFTDDGNGGKLDPKPPDQRGVSPALKFGNLRRCPGAATAPPADGSAPFVDNGPLANPDCDPSQVPSR